MSRSKFEAKKIDPKVFQRDIVYINMLLNYWENKPYKPKVRNNCTCNVCKKCRQKKSQRKTRMNKRQYLAKIFDNSLDFKNQFPNYCAEIASYQKYQNNRNVVRLLR